MSSTVPVTYFGMTLESLGYNFGYYGGPVEALPAIPISIVRSWDVWSPGNGQIAYLDWSDLNPSAGVYNWTALNAWIATNQANNAQMVYTFGDPPAWAGGTTTNLADFQTFVTAIVTQANGAIKYWEGFNEFDVSGIAPALLVQLQKIIYTTVHALDPGALVLSPTVCAAGDDPLFAQFLADGGGKYFDIAAFHGYNNSTGEGIVSVVQDFQAVLAQYGLSNVPIWDTEWGMEAPTVITDTTAQEAYVSTGLILQAALGVQTEMFYAYDNANSSLYNEATGQLTAAGVAYQQTEQWLLGATESGYQLNGSVYTVQLTKNGQTDLIVWNAAGQSTFSTGPYTQYLDTQGQLHSVVNGVVTIGTVPIFLETPSTPAAPVITSDTINGNNSVALTGTAEANSTVTVYDGQTALGTTTADASGAWSYTTGTLASGAQVFTATATNIAGISSAPSNAVDPIIGQVATVASVTASGIGITNGNGDLTVGSVVTLTLTASEAVTVSSGTPTLTLNDGGTATYTGGSGSSTTLTFSYTVAAGQNTPDLTVSAVNLNGATIKDGAGNNASLSGTLSPAGTLQIDTTAPTVASVAATGTGITNGNGDLKTGSVVTLTLAMSEAVTVAGGTPTLTLNDGGTATYTGGSGGTALTFSYTVAAGQNTPDLAVSAVNLNGATIRDGAGNSASLSGTISPAGTLQIDATAPTMASVATSGTGITNGNGDLKAGSVVTLTLTMSEAVTVAGGTPTLTLNDGGTATYTGGSGSTALTFSYTVAAGQNTPDLSVSAVNLNGATIKDGAGNSASLSGTLSPAGTLQIDTTAPVAPVITSDAVNGDNSVTLSGTAEANGTVTVYDGQTALGTTTANASGVWSYTTTPLANGAQTFTATATDAAGNTSAASNAIDPIIGPLAAPTIVSFSPDSGTVGDHITNATTLTLTGTGEANTTVEVFDGSTELGTAAVNASGAWSFVTGTLANGSHVFTATDTVSGSASAASAALSVTVNTVAPTVSSVAASGNGITNGSGDLDAGQVVTLTVILSEAVTVANGTPTLTLNDGATATYTGGSGSDALTFSYTVAAGQNTSDLAVTAVKLGTATITDAAGNAANLTGAVTNLAGTLQIDTAAPTVKTVTAAPTSGDVETGGNVTITLTMSEIVDVTGTPVLSLNDGGGATYLSGSGTSTLVFGYTVGPEENTTALQLTGALSGGSIADAAGNAAVISATKLLLLINVDQWTKAVSANWTTSADWSSPAGAPASFDLAVLNAKGTVTSTANETISELNTISTATLAIADGMFTITNGTGAGIQAGTISVANGAALEITGTFDNSGTLALNASGAATELMIAGNATLTGAGKMTFSNNAGNAVASNGASATLTNVNNTISGAGTIGDSYLTLVNQGTINANNKSLALVINTGSNTITNSGTLEGISTGGLDIESNACNSKTIEALGTNAKVVIEGAITNMATGLILASGSGANVDLEGATVSGGTLKTSGKNAVIETVGGSANVLDGGTISSGSTVEINVGTTLTLSGTVSNSGALLVNGGTLDVDGILTGGTVNIGGAGKTEITQASSENVAFLANSVGQLLLDQPNSYMGQISGFGANTSQSIDLSNLDFAAGVQISYAPNNGANTSGVLTVTDGTNTDQLKLTGAYTLANFDVASDGNGGTLITDPKVLRQRAGNAAASIASGAVLEINTPDYGRVTFAGSTGTLWLDQPATFRGTVAGFKGQDVIDLPGIEFGTDTTLGYSANSKQTGGTLSVTDGIHSANIALLGNYMSSSFVIEGDNHGGTMVVTAASQIGNQSLLANPHHS